MSASASKRGTPMDKIAIPTNAKRCVVQVRHSHSVQEGPNESRTLTTMGQILCAAVAPDYEELLKKLTERFGAPIFASSQYPRALLTAFLVTGANQIVMDERLNLDASVKKAPAPAGSPHPNLYAHWKDEGLGVPQMLQRLAADPSLFGNQPVNEGIQRMEDFVLNAFPESNLVIAFDHEPAISLYAAKCGMVAEKLGLTECQAMIFFLDAAGNVISIEKFESKATKGGD